MTKIDDILEQLKGQQPMIDDPDALAERIMDSLPDRDTDTKPHKVRIVPLRWWMTAVAAACVVLAVLMTWPDEASQEFPRQKLSVSTSETTSFQGGNKQLPPRKQLAQQLSSSTKKGTESPNDTPSRPTATSPLKGVEGQKAIQDHGDGSPNHSRFAATDQENRLDPMHYAVNELTKDTVPYQDPARVDDFIAKLAAYHDVRQGELECTQPAGSDVVSSVYVFPDNKEIDVFGRLLQVACCYSDETPGYHLNFSHQQFFFELKDMRKQLQYRWIAERINGNILLYGTNVPIGAKESPACYQEYRDELMHINSINKNPREI